MHILTHFLFYAFRFPLIVPSSAAVYIAPLFVILHKIPLARRALLNNFQDVVSDYGIKDDWWKGQMIDLSNQFITDGIHDSSKYSYTRLMIETQRFMAFLDGRSKRPYASSKELKYAIPSESVNNMKGYANGIDAINPVAQFLQDITRFPRDDGLLRRAFTSVAFTPRVEQEEEVMLVDVDSEERGIKTDFCNFAVDVKYSFKDSLYDLLDKMVWPDLETPSQCLLELGEVITISMNREDSQSGAGIDVPSLLYLGRYTKEVLPYVQWLHEMKKKGTETIGKLNSKNFSISAFRGKDVLKVLTATTEYFKTLNGERENPNLTFEDLNERLTSIDKYKETDMGPIPRTTDTTPFYPSSDAYKAAFDLTQLATVSKEIEESQSDVDTVKKSIIDRIDNIKKLQELQQSIFKGGNDLEIWSTLVEGYTRDEPANAPGKDLLTNEMPHLKPYRLSGVILSPIEYCFSVKAGTNADDVADLIMMDYKEEDGNTKSLIDDSDPAGDGYSNTSSVSTAAASTDSAQTAVSDSVNLYEWYKVSPKSKISHVSNHSVQEVLEATPEVTQISVPELLDLAKNGSSIYSGQEVTLIYATESEAWDDKKNEFNVPVSDLVDNIEVSKQQTLPKALANFLQKDYQVLQRQITAYNQPPEYEDSEPEVVIPDVMDEDDDEEEVPVEYYDISSSSDEEGPEDVTKSISAEHWSKYQPVEEKDSNAEPVKKERPMSMAERLSQLHNSSGSESKATTATGEEAKDNNSAKLEEVAPVDKVEAKPPALPSRNSYTSSAPIPSPFTYASVASSGGQYSKSGSSSSLPSASSSSNLEAASGGLGSGSGSGPGSEPGTGSLEKVIADRVRKNLESNRDLNSKNPFAPQNMKDRKGGF